MSLFRGPDEHAENPPETWEVRKQRTGRGWYLTTRDGVTLEQHGTKREAEAARVTGSSARLYAKEARWYAGEAVHPWRPWAEIKAERERFEARHR